MSDNIDSNGMPQFVDAGDGEELEYAEAETKKAVLRVVADRAESDDAAQDIRDSEPDIVKRAKALSGLGAIIFPDEKMVKSGDMIVTQPQPTDENRWAVFDAVFGKDENSSERPHIDTFRGRLVDWLGRIVDDRYSIRTLIEVCSASGLKGQGIDQVRKAFKEWAMSVQSNDLIKRFETKVPDWDGVERLDKSLIELFECFDTELNREFSRYFWLSLYARITQPGCFAPMVLSLFGAQNCGKSFMAKLICQEIIGSEESDSVQLDLSADKVEFLREITGNSIIASVGEMTGFNRGDLNKIKDFITRTGDNMHYKYEGNFTQMRQWVTVMDGNKYEGLQRDETGNRRFYPIFVGQTESKFGRPPFKDEYIVNFEGFREKIWPMMAECRAWFKSNGGLKGYENFVGTVVRKVAAFSKNEMDNDRGTIKDESLDVFLNLGLLRCKPEVMNGTKHKGVWVHSGEIANGVKDASRGVVIVKFNHLKPKMAAMGAEYYPRSNQQGYLFRGFTDVDEWKKFIRGDAIQENSSDDSDYSNGGF